MSLIKKGESHTSDNGQVMMQVMYNRGFDEWVVSYYTKSVTFSGGVRWTWDKDKTGYEATREDAEGTLEMEMKRYNDLNGNMHLPWPTKAERAEALRLAKLTLDI